MWYYTPTESPRFNPNKFTELSLCSGYGGITLGLDLALAGQHQLACCVEWETYAASILVARMEDKTLDSAPVWSDVTTFDGKPWRGLVDILTGGFPCQPFSAAGQKRGHDDERNLWPSIRGIVQEVRPPICFFENVAGLISTRTIHHRRDLLDIINEVDEQIECAETPKARYHLERHRDRLYRRLLDRYGISALHYVLCDLEALGYQVEAGLFSASELGATQQRQRVFIMAYCEEFGRVEGGRGQHRVEGREGSQDRPEGNEVRGDSSGGSETLAHADRERRSGVAGSSHGEEVPNEGRSTADHHEPVCSIEGMADPDVEGLEGVSEQASPERWQTEGRPVAGCGRTRVEDTQGQRGGPVPEPDGWDTDTNPYGSGEVGHAEGEGLEEPQPPGRREDAAETETGATARPGGPSGLGPMDDPSGIRLSGQGYDDRPSGAAETEHREADQPRYAGYCPIYLYPPAPNDKEAWEEILEGDPYLAPALTAEEAKSSLRGVAHGTTPVVDRLRCLGNGVFPTMAAKAFVYLGACLGIGAR